MHHKGNKDNWLLTSTCREKHQIEPKVLQVSTVSFFTFAQMEIPSKYVRNAVDQLASLPGIGRRTALRLVLQLMKRDVSEMEQFSQAFLDLKTHVRECKICSNITDAEICSICSDPRRDKLTICVVEDIRDILAIESTSSYKGVYHVLGGIISPMDGISPHDLNINSLIEKASEEELTEIILALSPTMEGDTTNFYLYKKLKEFSVPITTLSRGVSVGSELQYTDELTLVRSLQNRLPYHQD